MHGVLIYARGCWIGRLRRVGVVLDLEAKGGKELAVGKVL